MLNFSTLFDYNYLSRGLALYSSLKRYSSQEFKLYVLAMDDSTYEFLNKQKYDSMVVQSLNDIKEMYTVLSKLQKQRTRAEFSWTLSSFSIQFFIRKFNLESCTYVDSDVYFFNDPKQLIDKVVTESVLITPHNYSSVYDQSEISGRYCVQFMYFKNNQDGNEVLEWWRQQCEICCSAEAIDGKFGDQKYLDDWLSRFSGKVYECNDLGSGIAPWNVQKVNVIKLEEESYSVEDKITKVVAPLIFYHFHGLKQYLKKDNKSFVWLISDYKIDEQIKNEIYKKYISALLKYEQNILGLQFPLAEENKVNYIRIFLKSIKMGIGDIIKLRKFNLLKSEIRELTYEEIN